LTTLKKSVLLTVGYGTAAPWKPWKTNCMFSTVPTALGKLGKPRRVSHSSHSLCGGILIEAKRIEMLPQG